MLTTSSGETASEAPSKPVRAEIINVPATSDLGLRLYGGDDTHGRSATKPSGINASTLLHAFRRNWLLGLILGTILAVPLAAAPYLLLKLEYKASALIRISSSHTPVLFDTLDRQGAGVGRDFKSYKNTQRQLLLNPTLLSKALTKEDIAKLPVVKSELDPVRWLLSEMKVTFPDDAEIMQISLASTDDSAARNVVNAVVKAYEEEVIRTEEGARTNRVDMLERIQSDAKATARQKKLALKQLVENVGSSDSDTLNFAQQAVISQISLIRGELTKVQFKLMRAQGELKYYTKLNPASQPEAKAGVEATPVAAGESKKTELAPPTQGATPQNASAPPPAGQASAIAAAEPKKSDAALPAVATPTQNASPMPPAGPAPIVTAATDLEEDPKVLDIAQKTEVGRTFLRQIGELKAQVRHLEKQLQPSLATIRTKDLRERLATARKNLESAVASYVAPAQTFDGAVLPGQQEDPVRNLNMEIQVLKEQESQMLVDLKEEEDRAKKMGGSSVEVESARLEMESWDKIVERATDEFERMKIELKSSSRITVLSYAQTPQVGESKIRLPLTAAAGAFGLFGPLALLMALDTRRRYINDSTMVTDQTMIPILGALPMIPRRVLSGMGKNNITASNWVERFSESVDALTSLLLHKLEQDGHRVILIASAKPGEGKSTLATHLASSIAQSGHRTLLIDFDCRRPTLHRRFELALAPGATNVLRGGVSFSDAVREADTPNLHILTAGDCEGALLQDATNGSLKALFDIARTDYEIVLVDSCPLVTIMDGRLIGQYTDGTILSVIKDVSQMPSLMAARSILSNYNIPILGCVVTGNGGTDGYYGTYSYGPPKNGNASVAEV